MRKHWAGYEDKINNKDAKNSPQTSGYIRFFNKHADAPYFYVFTRGKEIKWGIDKKPEVQRIDLPVIGGEQATLDEIRQTAKDEKVSVREVLKRLGIEKEIIDLIGNI